MMELIGIDIGGSHITSVLINEDGIVLSKVTLSLSMRNVESVLDAIEKCTLSMAKSANVRCIGIAVPGNVDPLANCALYLPNFNWERNIPLGRLVADRLHLSNDCKISMRNDGRCAALAESKFGAGKDSNVFAFLTLGTGIGGALIINGTLFDGSSFDAGDFGHHVIRSGADDAFDCPCGKKGCFETQASADGLIRHYHKQFQKANDKDTTTSNNATADINAEKIILAMRNENEIAKKAFQNYMNDLSTGLANLVTFYNPDTIALGGGLSQANEIFAELKHMVDAKTLPATRGKVKIVPSSVGVDAGAIGAALLALSESNHTSSSLLL